jgi:hypothetical protein
MKLRKSNLIDSETKQPIYLPEYERGEEGYEQQQEIRRLARESTRRLIAALKNNEERI